MLFWRWSLFWLLFRFLLFLTLVITVVSFVLVRGRFFAFAYFSDLRILFLALLRFSLLLLLLLLLNHHFLHLVCVHLLFLLLIFRALLQFQPLQHGLTASFLQNLALRIVQGLVEAVAHKNVGSTVALLPYQFHSRLHFSLTIVILISILSLFILVLHLKLLL